MSFLKNQSLQCIKWLFYRTDDNGLIPAILDKWFQERVEFRKLEKKYGNSGDKEKHQYFKARQYVQKVLLNSLYGVLGLPTFRFYDSDNAEAVTLTGQSLIKYTEKMGNFYYQKELGVSDDFCIYIDTDSVFILFTNRKEEKSINRRKQ